jgi:hypothetical protein
VFFNNLAAVHCNESKPCKDRHQPIAAHAILVYRLFFRMTYGGGECALVGLCRVDRTSHAHRFGMID